MENGYIKFPSNENEWRNIAIDFENKWNFPHRIGAIDGKHVVMQAPPRSGSTFFNYKKTHSIVLMAVCDANYSFTLVDVGDVGRNSDGGVFSNSKLGYAITNKLLKIPEPTLIPQARRTYPYVFVGDEAFQLTESLMKPYPREVLNVKGQIFNYRLSRARRIIENSFGIAAARFRIFRRPIIARVGMVVNITKAVVALHNYLMQGKTFNDRAYCPAGFVDAETAHGYRLGDWRDEAGESNGLTNISNLGSHNYRADAKCIRENFRDFFSSKAGEVPWQWDLVQSTQNRFDDE